VDQMLTCTCGFPFGDTDAFCGKCGTPRPVAAAIPAGRAPGNGQWAADNYAAGAAMTQTPQTVAPSPFDADAVYLEKTLRHEPMELALDDSVSLRTLGIMLVRAYLAWGISLIVLGIFGGYEAAHGGGETMLVIAFIGSIIVFWFVLLGSRVTEPIGEWRTLLADRYRQAESYYRTIAAVLERRKLPITPRLRSIELNAEGRPVKHTIVLSENEYQTYVTVFPYGTSLYVGWQMWRRRSGASLIKRALADRVSAANLVTAMLRTDRARAVREAVHLACREALYTSVDENLVAYAQQVRMPQVEQEATLLVAQPASPVLSSLTARMSAAQPAPAPASPFPAAPAPSSAPAPSAPFPMASVPAPAPASAIPPAQPTPAPTPAPAIPPAPAAAPASTVPPPPSETAQ
jgi:hypothetical protein